MSSPAWEAMFGGAAGPGKTDCLVMEATRQIDNPLYNAILIRRVFPSLEAADGMIARSHRWYPALGGEYNWAKHYWTFPSGARIYFGHIQHESSKYLYQGAQFSFIGFDELTEFNESQYTYMMTRNRAPVEARLRVYIRSCTNPGNVGHRWVKERFITKDIVNQVRWFTNDPIKGDTAVPPGTPLSRSRAFYPARLDDNPSIGDEYLANLLADPDAVQRSRLIEGNWDAEYEQGLVYNNFVTAGTDEKPGNVTMHAEFNPDKPIIWGADDGYVYGAGPGTQSYHPRVILQMQVNELGGLNVFDEYVETGVSSYEDTVKDVLAKGYGKPDIVYIDSSAAMMKGSLWNLGFDVVGSTHKVSEGIRNLRKLVCDANGVRTIRVHPRCNYTIYEFGCYRHNEDAQGKDGEPVPMKQDDHAMDALRYSAWSLRFGE